MQRGKWRFAFGAVVIVFFLISVWASRSNYGLYYLSSLGCFLWSSFEIYAILFRDKCYLGMGVFAEKGWKDIDWVVMKSIILSFYVALFLFSACYGLL